MKTQLHMNEQYIKQMFLLGNLFSVPIEDVARNPLKGRAYFVSQEGQVGYMIEKDGDLSFQLKTNLGTINGFFCETGACFSLQVVGKPYDTIRGVHTVQLNSVNEIYQQSISCRFKKEEGVVFSMDVDQDSYFSIHQSYLHSPLPYEDISVFKNNDSVSVAHTTREGREFIENTQIERISDETEAYDELTKQDTHLIPFLRQIHDYLKFKDVNLYRNFTSIGMTPSSTTSFALKELSRKVYQR